MTKNLRISGGIAKGRTLRGTGCERVRPTSARVREALFSIVGQDLEGVRVLDAFGGTGLLAAEAWSRGATVCVVERQPQQVRAIRQEASLLDAQWDVRQGDVLTLAPCLGTFGLVLADPPYAACSPEIVRRLSCCVEGLLVLEAPTRMALPGQVGDMSRVREKVYGNTTLHLFRRTGGPCDT